MAESFDQRVQAIFLEACDLTDPEEVELLIRRRSAGDEEVAKEVRSLLRHHRPETILVSSIRRMATDTRRSFSPQRTFSTTTVFAPAIVRAAVVSNRSLLIGSLLAMLLLVAVGFGTRRIVNDALRDARAEELRTVLQTGMAGLRFWFAEIEASAETWANDQFIIDFANELVDVTQQDGDTVEALKGLNGQRELEAHLSGFLERREDLAFAMTDRTGLILASSDDRAIGTRIQPEAMSHLARVFEGDAHLSKPINPDPQRFSRIEPMIWVSVAVKSESHPNPRAALHLGMSADHVFTKILRIARIGESGETYAFDDSGILLSESRFNHQLKSIGLLEDTPDARSMLNVRIGDPGRNLLTNAPAELNPQAWPLTEMAANAIARRSNTIGQNVAGYRDYRGVTAIGAWQWMEDLDFGIATEIDHDQAFRPLRYVLRAFWIMFGTLVAAILIVLFSTYISLMVRHRAAAASHLGQYTLQGRIGSGGLGDVYIARHSMLRRPVAVKILKTEVASSEAIARFEREVQLTSLLEHPNTIQVFDYGKTPWGSFYYVMEYLDGIHLKELVEMIGPLPTERVLFLLRHVCMSLIEAHDRGIVHRDIKPGNIMICKYGGLHDFVKVLDFGLAKDFSGELREYLGLTQTEISVATEISGTPNFIAPERLIGGSDTDARCDIYALGITAYYLLTGRTPFDGDTPLEICLNAMHQDAAALDVVAPGKVPAELASLITVCIDRDPDRRPESARELLERLLKIPMDSDWDETAAKTWWSDHSQEIDALQALPIDGFDSSPVPGT